MKRIIQPSMRCTIRFTAENGRLPANSAERTAVIGAARPSVILSDEEGNPQFVIGIVEDITREKEMETALKEARSATA